MMKKIVLNTIILGLIAGAPASWAASRDEVVSTAADQQGVAVTIYNDNLALVKDARRVRLARDLNLDLEARAEVGRGPERPGLSCLDQIDPSPGV